MAIEHRDGDRLFIPPLTPEAQAAQDALFRAFMDGLPEASGTFSGHLVRDACYQPNGCRDGCPVAVEVAGEQLGMTSPN